MKRLGIICVIFEWIFALAALIGGILLVRFGHIGLAIPAFFFFAALVLFGIYQLILFRKVP